jgi:hypothetical protein
MRIRAIATPGKRSSQETLHGEPLTFGVPLPSGFAGDVQHWTFGAGDRPGTPVQTRVLDRWADGSPRWVLVDVQADVISSDRGGVNNYFIDCGPNSNVAAPQSGITIAESGGTLTVDTVAARFTLCAGGRFPFEAVQVGGSAALDVPASGLSITDAGGVVHRASITAVEVEERGVLRSVVKLTGSVPLSKAGQALDLTARVHFFAGLPTVRLLVTLTNPNRATHPGGFWDLGDPGSILIKDVALTLTLPTAGTNALVQASREIGSPWARFDAPFELYQDSSGGENWQSPNHINRAHRVPNSFKGYRLKAGDVVESGLRATPVVAVEAVEQGSAVVAATMPHFWQNFPKAIEALGCSLTLRLFPGQYGDLHEIQGGEQKTHECFLSFGSDRVSERPLEWCRARTIARVDPDWCLASGAVPFLAPLDESHAALVNAAVEGPDRFEVKREAIDEYGWRHFGEIYGDHESAKQKEKPLISHYNNQYDPIAGFAYQFLRTGDPRWSAMMSELAAHVVNIDVYHTVRDKWTYNHGLFWHTYHYGDADTATHRTYPLAGRGRIHGGGPSADHNYTTGLMLHYFLTGEESSRRTAVDLAEFVINLDDGRKTVFRWLDTGDTGRATLSAGYYGPGRGPANSVNALVDGHRLTGDSRFLAKAEQLIRRVVHPEEDITKHRLDDPEARWFYTMFLQSLGKYLHYKAERVNLDAMYAYGRASLLHYTRWMEAHEYPYLEKPEKLEFPTETWAAQDIRKSDVFYYAALHASGEERVTFEERGRFFHRSSIDLLKRAPTRAFARPVIVLLTSGFMEGWFTRHPGSEEPKAPDESSFGQHQVFVPQRARAEKRAKWLAATGAILMVIVAALLLWR